MNPKVSDVHLAAAMSGFSVMRGQHRFVGNLLLPMMRVNKTTDKFFTDGDEHFFLHPTEMGETGVANEIDYTLSNTTYVTIGHGLRAFVSDEVVREADQPLRPERRANRLLEMAMAITLEQDIATVMGTGGNYASGHTTTLSGTNLWTDDANSDPIGDIDTGIKTVSDNNMERPNVMVIGNAVWNTLKNHSQLIERVKYQGSRQDIARVDLAAISDLFGIPTVVVGHARKFTHNEGGTETLANIWDDDVFITFTEGPRPESAAFGKVFWNISQTDRYRQRDKGLMGGTYIQRVMKRVITVTKSTGAYAILNAV
tara:strand:- start:838 stop:1776 length:939 start_codon:yes stop_codon:yes gene_type:complete